MKKILSALSCAVLIWGCAENPRVTFKNSTNGNVPISVNFHGEEKILKTLGSTWSLSVETVGSYTFSSTAPVSCGVKEIDEKSCSGGLNLQEDGSILVTYYLVPADAPDSANGLIYKLWAAVTDQRSGSPLAVEASQ